MKLSLNEKNEFPIGQNGNRCGRKYFPNHYLKYEYLKPTKFCDLMIEHDQRSANQSRTRTSKSMKMDGHKKKLTALSLKLTAIKFKIDLTY